MKRIEIKNGLTNTSFKKGNKFIQKITKNKFNHNLDYTNLKEFDFVPKFLKQKKDELFWKFIESKKPKITKDLLTKIGIIMRKIHLSNIELPPNNTIERCNHYLKIINDKKIRIPEIHNNFIAMNKLMRNMGKLNSVHNDIWLENLLQDKNGKIWMVDWEYATMGDRHFDIAYFIESAYLNQKQEAIFLKSYKNYEVRDYEPFNKELLPKYKQLVNYITLLWLHSRDKLPFSDEIIKKRMKKKI